MMNISMVSAMTLAIVMSSMPMILLIGLQESRSRIEEIIPY